MKTIPTPARRREIITNMIRRRSIVALICGIFTLLLGFYGIIAGINKTIAELNKDAFYSFIYYTMLVNTMAALSVSFIIPYAIDGIKKREVYSARLDIHDAISRNIINMHNAGIRFCFYELGKSG